jgi:hypothetical protein
MSMIKRAYVILRKIENQLKPTAAQIISAELVKAQEEGIAAKVGMVLALAENTQQLKLHMGEMTAQELRTLRAGLRLVAYLIHPAGDGCEDAPGSHPTAPLAPEATHTPDPSD